MAKLNQPEADKFTLELSATELEWVIEALAIYAGEYDSPEVTVILNSLRDGPQ